MELLESLGDKLGILEKVVEVSARAPAKIQTRSVTLTELKSEISAEEVRSLADLPAELTISFEKIYETAGVAPKANGWSIDKLSRLLQTDAFKDLDREGIQKRILTVLGTEKVGVEDLIKDAVARDKALDAFETFAGKKMEDRTASRGRKLSELETRILELQKESNALKDQAMADRTKWNEWRKRKRDREHELARTVGYLIDRPVITTDGGD